LASFVGSSCFAFFGWWLGYEVLQKFTLLEFVVDGKAVILTHQIHQLLEMVIAVLRQRPIHNSDFSFLGACGVIIPPASVAVLPSVPSLTVGLAGVT
jgi:hypothetical protein